MTIRLRIESGFELWTAFLLRWRYIVVLVSLLLIGGLSTGAPRLEIETSFESYLPRENPARELYTRFREEFGSGERVVLLLRPADLYDVRFLEELSSFHSALEAGLPYIDQITSLVNARHLIGTSDALTSEGLLDELPAGEEDLARLRQRVRANPLYRNVVVSADESATAIVIEFDAALGDSSSSSESDHADLTEMLGDFDDDVHSATSGGALLTTEQSKHLVRALDEIIAAHAPRSADLFVAGTPLLAHRLGRMLTRDIAVFASLSVLTTALLLFLLFRSPWAVIHPLVIVGLSVAGTLGWMGLAGIPLTAVTEILPSLLIAIGVGDAIHIQAMFYRHREDGNGTAESIRWAVGHSGLAVLLTSVTTAASMASFRAAELAPVVDLGRVAPVGVGLAFLLSITLLPVLLSITPVEARAGRSARRAVAGRVDSVLLALGGAGTRRPGPVLGSVALLWGVALAGAASLHFSQDDLRWLPEDDALRLATEEVNRALMGAEDFELLVEIDSRTDLLEPAVLETLREIEVQVKALRVGDLSVAQGIGLSDVIEETHRALGSDPEAPLELPASRAAVSQELLLFESAAPEDLARLVNTSLDRTRIAMTVPFVDALYYPRFSAAVAQVAGKVLHERGLHTRIEVLPTGLLVIAGETFDLLFVSMVRSYVIAFGVIALLTLILIGKIRLGLLSTLPNVTPILAVLGLMGWLGAPLDMSSMLIGGILIGVVVDDTIHFAHNFARYRAETGCSLRAVRETLLTTGRAMLVTSLVLSLGFFTFTGAVLSNIAGFGLLCGIGVILAFLADLLMLPALVALVAPCAASCRAHAS